MQQGSDSPHATCPHKSVNLIGVWIFPVLLFFCFCILGAAPLDLLSEIWYPPEERKHGGGEVQRGKRKQAAQVSWRKGVKVWNSLGACGALTFLPVPSVCTHHFSRFFWFSPLHLLVWRMQEQFLPLQLFKISHYYLKGVHIKWYNIWKPGFLEFYETPSSV